MITGFNTDVEHNGVIYHVQTEDKGLASPLLLTLIYQGGAILASRRTPYDDLIAEGFDEKILIERLQRQHKLICAAIRANRINDLQRKSASELKTVADTATDNVAADEPVSETISPVAALSTVFKPESQNLEAENAETAHLAANENHESLSQTIFEAITEAESPVKASVIVNPKIQLLNEKSLLAGESTVLQIQISAENEDCNLKDLPIKIKLIGTSFSPLIYSAQTDDGGLANCQIKILQFDKGRGVLLINATVGDHELELRRIVQFHKPNPFGALRRR